MELCYTISESFRVSEFPTPIKMGVKRRHVEALAGNSDAVLECQTD